MFICIPRKVATVATVVTLRIFQRGVFFICVSFSLNFQALVRIFHVFCPLPVQSLFTDPWFFLADPRGPNFAEIHARGRRGRLVSEPRDLIPPWGYRLLHGEAEKPTTAVGVA